MTKGLFASTTALACILLAQGAMAQEPQVDDPAAPAQGTQPVERKTQVETVVVTAQKRSQRLQDVPLAVTAFSEKNLEDQTAQNLTDLTSQSPNVVLAPVGAYPFASAFAIRGLGFADVESSFEPTVGLEVNGVFFTRNSGVVTDFFDIDRIEILRGPQGTLYGRNTIGGVVSIKTKRPSGEYEGAADVTVGDHGRFEFRGSADAPLVEGELNGRVSMLYKSYDGFGYNDVLHRDLGGNEVLAGRATFAFAPSENFDATLILDAERDRGDGPAMGNASLPTMVISLLGYPADTGDPFVVHTDAPQYQDFDTYGATLEMNWDVGFGTITSVSGARYFDEAELTDFDGAPITFLHALRDQTHRQYSEELRITSNGENVLDYVFGVYAMTQNYRIVNTQNGSLFGGLTLAQKASQDNDAYAAFGQLDWHPVEPMTLTAGGRYSYESKDFTNQPLGFPAPMSYSDSWRDFSPKVAASYRFSDEVMAYAQWARGFRSGGFNGRAASYTTAGPYDAENVSAYEVGLKTDLFDRHLRLNADIFWSTYEDMQVGMQRVNLAGVHEAVVSNAGQSHINGVEVEAHAVLTSQLRLDFALGYLDAGFDEFFADLTADGVANPTDNSNLPLSFAPEWSGSFGFTYDQPINYGMLTLQAMATYTDDMFTSFSTLNATNNLTLREENTLYDATLAWTDPDERWRVAIWGKNLADETVINNTFTVGPLLALRIYMPPRTFGLEVSTRF